MLKQAGCEKIFTDTASGARINRLGLKNDLQSGGILLLSKLDCFGCLLQHLIEVIKSIQEKKIEFQSAQKSIDTTTRRGNPYF